MTHIPSFNNRRAEYFTCGVCGIESPKGRKAPMYCSVKCRNIALNTKRWSVPRVKSPKPPIVTAVRVRELLRYDPATGLFTRLIGRSADTIAGSLSRFGYVDIAVDRRIYKAHRLAWLYMTGDWPTEAIDHANLIRSDNRWANLRAATASQNRANTKARGDNSSGTKGVYWESERKKWRAQIQTGGKKFMLGDFDTREDAHAAYCKAAEEHFKEFARVA